MPILNIINTLMYHRNTQTGLMYGQRLQNLIIASTAFPNDITLPYFQACAGATDTCRVFCLLVWRKLRQQQIDRKSVV